jgi:hypothetical protein
MAVAAVGSSSTPELADLLDEAGRVLAGLVPASEEGDPVLMAEVLIELAGSAFLAEATRSGRRRVLSDGVERDSSRDHDTRVVPIGKFRDNSRFDPCLPLPLDADLVPGHHSTHRTRPT